MMCNEKNMCIVGNGQVRPQICQKLWADSLFFLKNGSGKLEDWIRSPLNDDFMWRLTHWFLVGMYSSFRVYHLFWIVFFLEKARQPLASIFGLQWVSRFACRNQIWMLGWTCYNCFLELWTCRKRRNLQILTALEAGHCLLQRLEKCHAKMRLTRQLRHATSYYAARHRFVCGVIPFQSKPTKTPWETNQQ